MQSAGLSCFPTGQRETTDYIQQYFDMGGLDTKRQSLAKAIADMSAEAVSPEQMKRVSGYLENWGSIGFEDRRLVVDGLVSTIRATSESVRIEWKI